MLGHEYYRTRYQSLDAYKTNMYSFDIPELSAAVNAGSADSYSDDYNTEGWFGRVQYNYAEKYFGSVSLPVVTPLHVLHQRTVGVISGHSVQHG